MSYYHYFGKFDKSSIPRVVLIPCLSFSTDWFIHFYLVRVTHTHTHSRNKPTRTPGFLFLSFFRTSLNIKQPLETSLSPTLLNGNKNRPQVIRAGSYFMRAINLFKRRNPNNLNNNPQNLCFLQGQKGKKLPPRQSALIGVA